MKKVLFTLAMVLGLGTSVVFAQDPVKTDSITKPVESPAIEQTPQSSQGEFKIVNVDELPGVVIETLKKESPTGTITGLFVAEINSGKIYKIVVLKDKNDPSSEQILLLDEKGEKVDK